MTVGTVHTVMARGIAATTNYDEGLMSTPRDWGGFRLAARLAQYEVAQDEPVIACPKCGTLVSRNAGGVADCPLGHWRSATADPRWEDYKPG